MKLDWPQMLILVTVSLTLHNHYLSTAMILTRVVPMRKVVWENDTALMDNDPFDGRFWTQDDNFTDSPWDALKRGAWIQVPHTPKLGIFGGLPLPKYALAGQNFSPEAQGFVPAV
jgi:hypothetical protein